MQSFLKALDEKVGWLLNAVAFVTSLLVVGLMLFLILARYVFGWSLVGTLELVMLFGMWLYMTGAMIASRRREHLVVDFLELQLRDARLKALHKTLVAVIVAIISACFVYWAQRMLAWGIERPQHTPELSIPLWVSQAAIMLASVGCFCYALRDVWQGIAALRGARSGYAMAGEES
ncbi:TRAP transporter small permease [Halomonas sp. MCCC 1A17488]|uniref:TRAP transporter small permease protein n=1 Tax=Billgrantia sulfidoxydans TaxID=2733484 RepID=A0ABX7W1V6_9GAMM|nr:MULTISPECIES: TRAP transporter small permease [Halomonas]MCE8015960.1 TRAP transporter small permease [Halomonas sp. MCCC 1A17488]MCG3239293.1 TRAP transporter small permease [Halomonas sp. MCCC 1A17488]QPP50774.1 TRAP transporter small permease [Halomonas sp. SS10-MC5]QTP54349.1 TRAP transporter small permease [Halomonas sulfidoxydans]